MTYHTWGDDWPYWDFLYRAEAFIELYVSDYSDCVIITKEKYGTIRYERLCERTEYGLKQDNPEKLKEGLKATKKAVKLACLIWPEVRDEIMEDFRWFVECEGEDD